MKYYKERKIEKNTYTIDWFSLRFGLSLTKELWTELEEAVKVLGERCTDSRSWHTKTRYGKFHEVTAYQFDNLHLQFYDDAPVIDLQFNPNNLHLNSNSASVDLLNWLLGYLSNSVSLFSVEVLRVDYAIDIPCKYSEVYVWSRKDERHYKETRYYGQERSSGMLRVYDKTLERRQKKMPISEQITRCEWVQRKEKPFTYDLIGVMDFSSLKGDLSIVSLIPPEHFNEAMRRLSWKSSKLIKETCFKTLSVDANVFDELLSEYSAEYRLSELRLVSLQNRLSDASLPSVLSDDAEDDESACSEW